MRPVNLHLEGIHLEDITGVGAEDLYLGLIMGVALITDSGLIMDMAHITDLDRIMGTGRIAEAWAQDEDFITEAGVLDVDLYLVWAGDAGRTWVDH